MLASDRSTNGLFQGRPNRKLKMELEIDIAEERESRDQEDDDVATERESGALEEGDEVTFRIKLSAQGGQLSVRWGITS